MSYSFNITLNNISFHEAIEKVTAALQTEGFGVLTEINVTDTFKNKLDVDFRPYKILGACNPQFAYKAIAHEDKIGVFLPCNIIVQEPQRGTVEISAVDPIASMSSVNNEALSVLASEVQEKLQRVIAQLK